MEYHMLYVESRKSFKVKREKNLLFHAVIAQIQSIALNKLKLSNRSKKLPKLHINQSMFSTAYTKKVLKSNTNLTVTLTPNHSQHYDSSSEILRFINIVRDRLCKTLSIFTITSTYDIMRS